MSEQAAKLMKMTGWVLSAIGGILYIYGFYFAESAPFVNWLQHMPEMVADFLPNWQAEIGLALSLIGTVFIYYPEFKQPREEIS